MATFYAPPGPAPVADMGISTQEDDDVDMDAPFELDDNVDMLSEPESMPAESSSQTTTESEVSEASGIDWEAVGVDYLTTQEALEALGERKPIPRPPKSNARPAQPSRPPPRRVSMDGVKTFVQWIPYWCDPEWDDKHHRFDTGGPDREWVDALPVDRQRPALLPQDAAKNPTPYAKRFGIYRDQTDGRSRLSPSLSTTRRVQLTHNQDTYTGRKNYVTVEDAEVFVRLNNPDAVNAPSGYFQSLLKEDDSSGNREQIQAYVQLHDLLEQDEALQHALFMNCTTDERIAFGAHSLDSSLVKCDIDGPLHPLVDRRRWMSTTSRGAAENRPRYLYNIYGNRGEWSAHDDHVWLALQPAFQLVTRILNTNHPFWVALLDANTRRHIDPSRNAYGLTGALETNWISFAAQFGPTAVEPTDVKGQALMLNSAAVESHGYNIPGAVAGFLADRLRIGIYSSTAGWNKGEVIGDITWGETCKMNINNPETACVIIRIGAEVMWPLLTPEFTYKEKASCSVMIAATMLHELAHAAHMAMMLLLGLAGHELRADCRQLAGLPDNLVGALSRLYYDLESDHEPFFEEEQMNELGFSFEKQIFGGTLDPAMENDGPFYRHHLMMPVALQLGTWPAARYRPHIEDASILVDPPLPVDQISTLLSVDNYLKFFNQNFWDYEFAKFGHQALKLNPDTGSLTILKRRYTRRKDLQRMFGESHGEWLKVALTYLRNLGHGLLSIYCRDLMHEKMEAIWVRKRFHHECKVWPVRNAELDDMLQHLHNHTAQLYRYFQDVNSSEAEKWQQIAIENAEIARRVSRGEMVLPQQPLDMVQYTTRLFNRVFTEINVMIANYQKLHHHLLHEIRCTQTLVVDYLQQKPEARQHLHRHYGAALYTNIEELFEPVIQKVIGTLQHIRSMLWRAGGLLPSVDTDLQRIIVCLHLDLNHFSRTKFFLTADNVEIQDLFWTGELQTIPRGRDKKRSKVLKRAAIKELLGADEVVRTLVETFIEIVDINKAEVQREQDDRKLEAVMKSLEKDLQANPRRRALAEGAADWLRATPSRTPEENGMAYAQRPSSNVRPWEAAPPPPPSSRGLFFGQPNLISPTPAPAPVTAPTFASKYASAAPPFPSISPSRSVLRQQQPPQRPPAPPHPPAGLRGSTPADRDAEDVFATFQPDRGASWGPFGTAWSDSRTTSAELRGEGVATPELRNVFGAETYRASGLGSGGGGGMG